MKNSLEQKRRKVKRGGRKACAFALSLAVMVPSIELPSYAAVSYRNGSISVILSILVDTFTSKISLPMQPVPQIGSISVS